MYNKYNLSCSGWWNCLLVGARFCCCRSAQRIGGLNLIAFCPPDGTATGKEWKPSFQSEFRSYILASSIYVEKKLLDCAVTGQTGLIKGSFFSARKPLCHCDLHTPESNSLAAWVFPTPFFSEGASYIDQNDKEHKFRRDKLFGTHLRKMLGMCIDHLLTCDSEVWAIWAVQDDILGTDRFVMS